MVADNILAKSKGNGGLSLYEHTLQVVKTAEYFAQHVGLDKQTARYGAILHDLGKAHPDFQKRLTGITDSKPINNDIPLRHEISSILFLPLFEKEYWDSIIDMVIAHHKSIADLTGNNRGKGIVDLTQQEDEDEVFERHTATWDWHKKVLEILEAFSLETRTISLDEAREAFDYVVEYCEYKPFGWSKWRGLLMSADYFASALMDQTDQKLPNTFKVPDLSFYSKDTRKSTLYPLSLRATDSEKRHTLVIAPTGAGKTDFLLKRCKQRIFYTLPFQASINAMYDRLKANAPDDDIRLLHAASKLKVYKNDDGNEQVSLQPLVGSAIKVLTPHQLAGVIFATRGFESLALDLKGNDVILDEIHSYNDFTQAMVFEIVKGLKHLGCNIHIGSATMPSVLTNLIKEFLGGSEHIYEVTLPDDELETYNRHVIHKHESNDDVIGIISEAIQKDEKVLVIANQVLRAQALFDDISNQFPHVPQMLLHSRFKRGDRSNLEQKIMNEFDASDTPCIVVSTQVVEVSLDISFDRMITECAPIDSLIQRFGRVNRRRSADTIGKHKSIHVIAPPADGRDALPYKQDVLQRSFDALPNNAVLEEKTLQEKIDSVYTSIDFRDIDSHLQLKDGSYQIKELCHQPKSYLLEALDIQAGTCVVESDADAYQTAHPLERQQYEIPVPFSFIARNIRNFRQLEYGTNPLVIPDDWYDDIIGLRETELSNFL